MKSVDCANRVLRAIYHGAHGGLGYQGDTLRMHLTAGPPGEVIAADYSPYPGYRPAARPRQPSSRPCGRGRRAQFKASNLDAAEAAVSA